MRMCEEILHVKYNFPVIIVITGNGKDEFRILSAISKKYNGDKRLLWFPLKPLNKKVIGKGLNPLKSLLFYPGKFGFCSFLFLVDREHIKEPKEELEKYIKNALKISVEKVEYININTYNDALKILCRVGSRTITVYVCIFGQKKHIEENKAILMKHELNIDVEPEKERIRNKLKELGISIEELIERSSHKKLEVSFPGLISILKELEK